MIEGEFIAADLMKDESVQLTVRPEGKCTQHFTTTPEQAQKILTQCRLGSQVRVTTSVDMEPVDPVGVASEAVMGEDQNEESNTARCGIYRTKIRGALCTRPAGHAGNHANHRVAWW